MLGKALDRLRARQAELLALTERWVSLNSYTRNIAGVDEMGRLLAESLALPGITTEEHPSPEFGKHLVFRSAAAPHGGNGHAARGHVMLIGHHDTVFPPGHFEGWRSEGDIGRGPGALDMKGGLAIMRTVLAALSDIGVLDRLPVVMVSVSDEELGSPDSQPLLRRVATGASAALVFEAGRKADAIVTMRRGSGAVEAIAHGRAAHAGNNHKDGANAIWALARFIDGAQRLTDYEDGSTVNVGVVTGGTTKNTVPDRASCSLDLRFDTAAAGEELMEAFRAAAKRAADSVPGTRIELEGGLRRLPLERTEASGALLAEYAACARACGLGADEAALMGGGSDANTVGAMGIPAIDGLGPRGSGFHTKDEMVELSSFLPKAEALCRFLIGRLRE